MLVSVYNWEAQRGYLIDPGHTVYWGEQYSNPWSLDSQLGAEYTSLYGFGLLSGRLRLREKGEPKAEIPRAPQS